MQDVYIIGVDTLKFGKYLDKSIKDLAALTATACLKDAGLSKEALQAIWFSNAGWGDRGQTTIRGQVALKPMGIDGIPITNVENACAGGSTALHHAWLGVAGGLYDITMAIGAEKLHQPNKMAVFMGFLGGIDVENVIPIIKGLSVFELTASEKAAMESFKQRYQAQAPSSNSKNKAKEQESFWKKFRDRFTVAIIMGERVGYDTMWQLAKISSGDHSPFMDIYGYAARQHMQRYGSTVEQLALVASKNHFNSTLNPNAQYQFEVPVEKVLADRIVTWPLTRAMCAPIGDGSDGILRDNGPLVYCGYAGHDVSAGHFGDDQFGAGCCRIHASVLRRIAKPWWRMVYQADRRVMCECAHFRLKAEAFGIRPKMVGVAGHEASVITVPRSLTQIGILLRPHLARLLAGK